MRTANIGEIKLFKIKHCRSENTRMKMSDEFEISIESFEELIPGQKIQSYATGSREIEDSFIMFRVTDETNEIEYFPVFSESVSRKLIKEWNLNIPKKISIFSEENSVKESIHGEGNNDKKSRNITNNRSFKNLISYSRFLMVHGKTYLYPMNGVMKKIYDKLEKEPESDIYAPDIKSINTALGRFLDKGITINGEKIINLQDYIEFLIIMVKGKKLKKHNFDNLREIFRNNYREEMLYF